MVDDFRLRETELLTYFRNSIVDPEGRGATQTDNHTGDGTTTQFELDVAQVKNILTVTLNGVQQYIGYHYNVAYGEGGSPTFINFKTAPGNGLALIVTYSSGESIIYEGFQRLDSKLPRMSLIFRGSNQERVGIGDALSGSSDYYVYESCNYVCEIRSRYANQMKSLMNNFTKLVNRYRQITPQPYNLIDITVTSKQPFDFDDDLRIYRAQVSFMVKWMVKF
jgi:hypothetical protein